MNRDYPVNNKEDFVIELPSQVEWILKKLRDRGYEAFAVGGCVRDTILNRKPGDWDITTSARPEQVKAVFGKTVDTGLQHGTVTVIRDHVGYEITTYRIDGEYEDGRHPKEVEFTADLREDLRRRDFTINAMAYSHETGLVDIFGGLEDLKAGRIRCVGNAMERFTEDALRIMRAVRFAAQLNFTIEEETWRALSAIAPNLSHVSKERNQGSLKNKGVEISLNGDIEDASFRQSSGRAGHGGDGDEPLYDAELSGHFFGGQKLWNLSRGTPQKKRRASGGEVFQIRGAAGPSGRKEDGDHSQGAEAGQSYYPQREDAGRLFRTSSSDRGRGGEKDNEPDGRLAV